MPFDNLFTPVGSIVDILSEEEKVDLQPKGKKEKKPEVDYRSPEDIIRLRTLGRQIQPNPVTVYPCIGTQEIQVSHKRKPKIEGIIEYSLSSLSNGIFHYNPELLKYLRLIYKDEIDLGIDLNSIF